MLKYKHDKLTKGVDDIMGGKVLEYEAKTIRNKALEQGRNEGALQLASAIDSLKSGKSADDLIKAGIDSETVNLALKYVG